MASSPFFINLARLFDSDSDRIQWGSFIKVEPGNEPGQINVIYVPEGSFSTAKIRNVPETALKDVPAKFAPSCGAKLLTADGKNPSLMQWLGIEESQSLEEMRRQINQLKARETSAETEVRHLKMGEDRSFRDFYHKRQLAARAGAEMKRLPRKWRGLSEEEEEYE